MSEQDSLHQITKFALLALGGAILARSLLTALMDYHNTALPLQQDGRALLQRQMKAWKRSRDRTRLTAARNCTLTKPERMQFMSEVRSIYLSLHAMVALTTLPLMSTACGLLAETATNSTGWGSATAAAYIAAAVWKRSKWMPWANERCHAAILALNGLSEPDEPSGKDQPQEQEETGRRR